jgi:membrane-associated protease RseP (regulator of RpoE activity)
VTPDLDLLFAVRHEVFLHDLEVVHGVLRPGLSPADPAIRTLLHRWTGTRFVRALPDGGAEVTLVRRAHPRPRERWWLHALLLLGALFTTTLSGAFLAGWEPRAFRMIGQSPVDIPVPVGMFLPELLPGLWFSLPLMTILLAHESGHYAAARRHGMDVSPPYLLPAPYFLSLIGSFGAFIRLRSPLVNRAVLLDVGAAGPLAGFAVALPVAALGLWLSHPLPAGTVVEGGHRFVLLYGAAPAFSVAGSLGFHALAALAAPSGPLVLHPLAVAGWAGFFFTALNLLPVSQLDGGHVLFALLGARQRWVGVAFLGALVLLGFLWSGWWVWAVLVLAVGRGRVRHPSVWDPRLEIGGWRRAAAWACIVVFALTFVPLPF